MAHWEYVARQDRNVISSVFELMGGLGGFNPPSSSDPTIVTPPTSQVLGLLAVLLTPPVHFSQFEHWISSYSLMDSLCMLDRVKCISTSRKPHGCSKQHFNPPKASQYPFSSHSLQRSTPFSIDSIESRWPTWIQLLNVCIHPLLWFLRHWCIEWELGTVCVTPWLPSWLSRHRCIDRDSVRRFAGNVSCPACRTAAARAAVSIIVRQALTFYAYCRHLANDPLCIC